MRADVFLARMQAASPDPHSSTWWHEAVHWPACKASSGQHRAAAERPNTERKGLE